jgi:hypothetical protein
MKRSPLFAFLAVLVASPLFIPAQTSFPPPQPIPVTHVAKPATQKESPTGPFTHWALGAGVSPLGVNMLVATNLSHNFDLRGTGNFFQYTINDISTNGFNVDANLNLATAGVSVDYYPFGRFWRLSPGALFYNDNQASGTMTATSGTDFTLNDITYYSSKTNPVSGTISLNLHKQNPAFTITSGFGRIVSSKRKHLSFPFELGVALISAPKIDINLAGYACDVQGANCVNMATDATVQKNLNAQIAKYNNDIDMLKFYPIVSFGVAYSFSVR